VIPVIPPWIKLAAGAACLVAAFSAGWAWQGSRKDAEAATVARAQAEATAEAVRKVNAAHNRERDALQKLADDRLLELQGAQNATNDLRDRVAADAVRLRIRATCPAVRVPAAGPAPSVGDGEGAELDPAARRAYFALRDGINRAEAKLAACQDALTVITGAGR
jgi:prophage endopeptidase